MCRNNIILLLLLSVQVHAQTQLSSSPIWYTSGGYVGIGAPSPIAPLDVYNGGSTTNNSNQLVALFRNTNYNSGNSSGEARIGIGWANHFGAAISAMKETTNTDGLRFYTEYGYNIPRLVMSINAWGNVQVGNPASNNTQLITFPGNYNFEALNLGQSGNGNSFMEFVNHSGTSTSYAAKMGANVDVYGNGFFLAMAPSATSYSALQYPSTPALFVNTNNQVGLNTTNTQGYQLAVNGSAIFTQVVVKNYANWPDYVFNNAYTPMPLDTLSDFIKKWQHLPGIPAAEEVKKDGQDLGKIQELQMQKIEELTLYVIQLQKEVEELKAQLHK